MSMGIIYLAHRDCTDLAQTDYTHGAARTRPPKKQRVESGNCSPRMALNQWPGHSRKHGCVCATCIGNGDTNEPINRRSGIYLELHLALQEGNVGCLPQITDVCLAESSTFKKRQFERGLVPHIPTPRCRRCRAPCGIALACKSRALLRQHSVGPTASCHCCCCCRHQPKVLHPFPGHGRRGWVAPHLLGAGWKAGKGLRAKGSLLLTALPPAGRTMSWGPSAPFFTGGNQCHRREHRLVGLSCWFTVGRLGTSGARRLWCGAAALLVFSLL